MKNVMLKSLGSLLIAIVLICSSCTKETDRYFEQNQEDTCQLESTEVQMVAGWWEHYRKREGCEKLGVFCRDFWDCLTDEDILDYELGNNQVIGTGSIEIEKGEEALVFEFTRNNLDESFSAQLLKEQTLPVVEHEFDPELVEELYRRAGLKYDGEPVIIEKGYYPVKILGDAGNIKNISKARIKVCIRKYIDEEGKIRRKLIIEIFPKG